ncbi:MAG: hypothetical protein DRI46_10180 [Chloroflexi bacterium]|nr:MAG: hypothetical protein DRI46_10180 [Chloroflexota bacterium]
MAGAYVNTWGSNSGSGTSNSITVAVSGPDPTVGNLLVGVVGVRLNAESNIYNDVAGWDLLVQNSGVISWAVYTRIAGSAGTNDFNTTWSESKRVASQVQEFSGLDSISPLDTFSVDTSNISGGSATAFTGTATPSSGLFAVAVTQVDTSDWGGDQGLFTVDSGFANLLWAGSSVAARPNIGQASMALADASDVSATFASNAGASPVVAGMFIFKEPGGATNPPTIDTEPQDVTVTEPASASMTTAATGADSSQWYKGSPGDLSSPQAGETGDTINWATTQVSDTGDYYNRYTNTDGDTDTLAATLTVNAAISVFIGTGDATLISSMLSDGDGTFVAPPADVFTGVGDGTLNSGMLGEADGTFAASTALFTGTGDADLNSDLTGVGTGIFGLPGTYVGTGDAILNSTITGEGLATFFRPQYIGNGDATLNSGLTGVGTGTWIPQLQFAGTGDADLNYKIIGEGLGTFSSTGQPNTGIYDGATPITSMSIGGVTINEVWIGNQQIWP